MTVYDYARVSEVLAGKYEGRQFRNIADQITELEKQGWEYVEFVATINGFFAIMRKPQK
jgi:hypothetical protein